MRDGVRLAIDFYLPPGSPMQSSTILRQTRYMRSLDPRLGASPILPEFDLYARTRRVFLAAGYAWVDVDVRGTGASSGTWAYPWSVDEVDDGVEVVDWILRQPWSDGRVGSLGISYDGTCADMLVTRKHPAVRAVAPTFALYDVFTDVAFPGGIHLGRFTELWATYNAALDRGEFHNGLSVALALMGTGARSRWLSLISLVPGDYPDRALRDARLLFYESAPLPRDTEVTGHPLVTLFLSSSAEDAHVFAYLEDVSPDGRVAYVTEGQLRLLHRQLATRPFAYETPAPKRTFTRKDASPMVPGEVAAVAFDLLPISWLFERGHRVRLALAGADMDHFDVMAPRTLHVHSSPAHPSRVELPVMRRA